MARPGRVALAAALLGAGVIAFGATGVAAQTAASGVTDVIKGTTKTKPVFAPRTPAVPAPLPDGLVPSEIGPSMELVVGKSTLLRLPQPIQRISVGNPAVADVTLISARELYLLGKTFGSTNVIMWHRNGPTTIVDVSVSADVSALERRLAELLPGEQIRVHAATDSLVLTGFVSSAVKATQAVEIAESFVRTYARGLQLEVMAGDPMAQAGQTISVGQAAASGGASGARSAQMAPRVINMLRVAQPQQVMLEVKVAEVSKTLLDKLGVGMNASTSRGSWTYSILSNLLSDSATVLGGVSTKGRHLELDAERKDGLIKMLAEPNIVAISGQEASFLAGGTIFIPVLTPSGTGLPTIQLEEKDFGVGLKFTPVVLDGGRIHLKVAPEVSELSTTGSPFTTVGGVTTILPTLTTRRAQTSVQLMDGQSLAIAGLIKNNATESVRRMPILGELPVLGALFRSSEFQTDRSELMFLITPRLVKPLAGEVALPTDAFTPPSRAEFFLGGQLEGTGSRDVPPDRPQAVQVQPVAPPSYGVDVPVGGGGFSMD